MSGMKDGEMELAERLFYAPSGMELNAGLVPFIAGRMMAKPNYIAGPKAYGNYCLHFLTGGTMQYAYNKEVVQLHKEDMFCMFPHERCTYKVCDPQSLPQKYWLILNGPQAAAVMEGIGLSKERPYRRQLVTRSVEHLMQMILQSLRKPRSVSSANKSDYYDLMGTIYRLIGELQANAHSTDSSAPPSRHWLQYALDFMNSHYSRGITVDEAAQYAGVHRSHFSEIFTKAMGTTPRHYLQRLRMNKAAEMLVSTSLSVTDIAQCVGYAEIYSFTKAFRLYYGKSPQAYRRGSSG